MLFLKQMAKYFGVNKVNIADVTGWKSYAKYRWLIHLLVWIAYAVFYYLFALIYNQASLGRVATQFVLLSWTDIVAAYITVYYLIPRFLLQKHYLKYFVYFLGIALLLIFSQRAILGYYVYPQFYPDRTSPFVFFKFNYLYTFLSIYVMAFIFSSVKLFEYWLVNQKQNQELKTKKVESELKFLKAQIHPHFLFNTLNNLYALTLDKSDAAPEVVVKLSELMNYMLYECNVPFIPLEKEIKYLNNYLDLEKIRYKKDLNAKIETEGKVDNKYISPLLLLPFVENAFKHGLSKNNDPWIQIKLGVKNGNLNFFVKNNKPKTIEEDREGYTEGIGLKNVKRRLDLLYDKNYTLDILEEDQTFTINLELKLSETLN